MYDHSPPEKTFLKRLPAGVANYPYIYQQKMNDLFHGFEFICEYIVDLFILKKETENIMFRSWD